MSIHDKRMHDEHHQFDQAMRTLHREALASVSPQVRWKLRPGERPPRGGVAGQLLGAPAHRWVAGATAALMAMVVGAALWSWSVPDDTLAPDAQLVAVEVDTQEEAATALEQDPDFYAWLASDDADLVAME